MSDGVGLKRRIVDARWQTQKVQDGLEYRTDDDKWEYISGSRRLPGSVIMSFPYEPIRLYWPCRVVQWSAWLTHRPHAPTLEVRNESWFFVIDTLYLICLQDLQADFQRQQRVLMNASIIEERNADKSARSRLNGPASTTTPHQNLQQDFAAQVGASDPAHKWFHEHDTKRKPKAFSQSPPTSQSHASNLPKTSPDHSDELKAYVPRVRGRADWSMVHLSKNFFALVSVDPTQNQNIPEHEFPVNINCPSTRRINISILLSFSISALSLPNVRVCTCSRTGQLIHCRTRGSLGCGQLPKRPSNPLLAHFFFIALDGSSCTSDPTISAKVVVKRLRDPIDQTLAIFIQLPATLVYKGTDYRKWFYEDTEYIRWQHYPRCYLL